MFLDTMFWDPTCLRVEVDIFWRTATNLQIVNVSRIIKLAVLTTAESAECLAEVQAPLYGFWVPGESLENRRTLKYWRQGNRLVYQSNGIVNTIVAICNLAAQFCSVP